MHTVAVAARANLLSSIEYVAIHVHDERLIRPVMITQQTQKALQAMSRTAPNASVVMLLQKDECPWLPPNKGDKQLIVGSANVGSYRLRNGDAHNPQSLRLPADNILAVMSVSIRHLPFLRNVGSCIDVLFFLWSVSRTEKSVIYGSFTGDLEFALTQYGERNL